jgi:hypothetical protein
MKYQDDSKALFNYVLSMGVELPYKTIELYNYLTKIQMRLKSDWINLYTQLSKLIALQNLTIVLLMSNKRMVVYFRGWVLFHKFYSALIFSLIAF